MSCRIWTALRQAEAITSWSRRHYRRRGTLTRDPDIFAIGDCAFLINPGETRPVPPRAQAAHQQASHLLNQMQRRLDGKPLQPFVYRDFGSLVSLGEYSTVGNLMGFISGKGLLIEGYFARLMYQSLYKMHQMALFGAGKVI